MRLCCSVGQRPVLLDDATYYVDAQGLAFMPAIINEAEYNAIVLKTVTTTYPQVIYPEATNPNATATRTGQTTGFQPDSPERSSPIQEPHA